MVNIQTSGIIADNFNFDGIRQKRADNRKHKAEAEAYYAEREQNAMSDEERRKVREEMGIHADKITISPESLEFMSHVDERKAAQRAEHEKLMAENPWNPFEYRGNLSDDGQSQYLVLSNYLYKNGFYDDMDDEEAGKMEDMLKSITAGMDNIRAVMDGMRSDSSLSHEAARLELVSSVNALNYFADKYVSEDKRDGFKDLIKDYESYNSQIVAKHKNSSDLYSDSMKNASTTNVTSLSADARQAQERTNAYRQIGKVTHTEQEEKDLKEDYQALFDKLKNKEDNARSIFDSLQNLLVNYAAGGSKNSMMLSILNANNSGSIENMFRYWSVML